MNTNAQILLADAPLPDPKTLNQQPAADTAKTDPLIAKGWEATALAGGVLAILAAAVIIGFMGRKT